MYELLSQAMTADGEARLRAATRTRLQGHRIPRDQGARNFPIEFPGPALDTDTFEITLPAGCVVDELTDSVNADINFGSYHSKTEVRGAVIRYTRTLMRSRNLALRPRMPKK